MASERASVRAGRGLRGWIASFASGTGVVLGTAAVYCVVGRITALMMSQHSYATAVWPAAGLSLAAVLRFGMRAVPGVLLGAFAARAGSSFSAGAPVTMARSAAVAAILAAGCALQVLAGARLVRRFVRQPTLLDDEQDILRFVLLAGPLACLVSTTVANTTLRLAGLAPWTTFPIGWATWWVGDTIGVILVAPLALILAESAEPWCRRRLPVGASLLLAFGLVTALFLYASRWERAKRDVWLGRRAEVLAHALDVQLSRSIESIESISFLMSTWPDIGRHDFHQLARRHLASDPGIQSIAWCLRVPAAQRDALEDATRRQGLPQFRIVERSPQGGMVPAAQRPEHVVIYYAQPHEKTKNILGFDIASEPARLEGLERAAATGRPAVTAPLRFLLVPTDQPGVLVISPAYESGEDGGAPRLRGFSTGSFRVGELVTAALQGMDRRGLALTIEDEAAPRGRRLLYTDGSGAEVKWRTVLDVGGRRWSVGVAPTAAWAGRKVSWIPWLVLAGGLFCVSLLGILLLVLLGRATRQELLAAERARLVEELRTAVTLRDEFLAIAAHELRTPLTSLLLQLQLGGRLLRAGGPGDPAPRLENAIRQASRLGRLVDDLLNASRITAGRLTLTRESVDLVEIVRETIGRLDEDARKAGCTITLSAPASAAGSWDRARLEQVVTNILSNALKFGAGKPVDVTVGVDEGAATLAVRDRGAGIPADALERIFRKFERGVSARAYGGLGLGLFISRAIAEAHRGTLRAESMPGEGATFILILPRSPGESEEAP